MNYLQAKIIADKVVAQLEPHCEKIKICGSLRRKKSEVSDIDIVCLPKIEPIKDLFGMISGHKRVDGFVNTVNSWKKLKGEATGKYTQREVDGMKVELSIAQPNNFGNLVLIRTGNAEFSHMIMKMTLKRGYEQREGFLYKNEVQIAVPEEMVYFQTVGIPYIHPELRNVDAFKK